MKNLLERLSKYLAMLVIVCESGVKSQNGAFCEKTKGWNIVRYFNFVQ